MNDRAPVDDRPESEKSPIIALVARVARSARGRVGASRTSGKIGISRERRIAGTHPPGRELEFPKEAAPHIGRPRRYTSNMNELWKTTYKWLMTLNMQEWFLMFVAVVLIGSYFLRGKGSRSEY